MKADLMCHRLVLGAVGARRRREGAEQACVRFIDVGRQPRPLVIGVARKLHLGVPDNRVSEWPT
jgi:hypothetical protein